MHGRTHGAADLLHP